MSDVDRLLEQCLKATGDAYRPSDPRAARVQFFARRRRRVFVMRASAVAVAGAALAAGIAVAQGRLLPDRASDVGPADATPAPPPTGSPVFPPEIDPSTVLFVYSANGHINAQLANGAVAPVTVSPAEDSHPTISANGAVVIFERNSNPPPGERARIELVRRDLATREETRLGPGRWPALARDGRLAWVESVQRAGQHRKILVGLPGGPPEIEFEAADGQPADYDVRHLSWSPDGRFLTWEVGLDQPTLYMATFDPEFVRIQRVVTEGRERSLFRAPVAIDPAAIDVLCCSHSPEVWEVGSVSLGADGAATYQPYTTIDPRLVDTRADEVFMVHAGLLRASGDAPGPVRWSMGETSSWLVSDGRGIYLVPRDGAPVAITGFEGHRGETEYAGIAMAPDAIGGVHFREADAALEPASRAPFVLWPEITESEAARSLAQFEDGHQPWRADATETALAFARGELGWEGAVARGTSDAGDFTEIRIARSGAPGAPAVGVALRKAVAGKYWSVVSVGDAGAGDRSDVDISVEGRAVRAGFAAKGAAEVVVVVGYGARTGRMTARATVDPDGELAALTLPGRPEQPGYFLVLWRDAGGRVFAAAGGALPAGDFAAR